MKEYYRINEIARLYSVSTDSLRYYEKLGLLKPKRAENGYRLYSLDDIYKLTVIRDLRALDFSMDQIRDYLSMQSISHTISMLKDEKQKIDERLASLKLASDTLKKRMKMLDELAKVKEDEISLTDVPERKCIQLSVEMTRDEEADFAIKKLHKKYEEMLPNLGDLDLGTVPMEESADEAARENKCVTYSSVFFIIDGKNKKYDYILPKGKYLSLYYRGGYEKTAPKIKELRQYIEENNMTAAGPFLELCLIDNRYTNHREEYLTEIQVQVERREG